MVQISRRYEILASDDNVYEAWAISHRDMESKFKKEFPELKFEIFLYGSCPHYLSYEEYGIALKALGKPELVMVYEKKLETINSRRERILDWLGVLDKLVSYNTLIVMSNDNKDKLSMLDSKNEIFEDLRSLIKELEEGREVSEMFSMVSQMKEVSEVF